MMQNYQPIECILHERLEFSVLRKIALQLEYRNKEGLVGAERVLPLDVYTRDGAEWLKFRCENGRQEEIRLDRILSFKEILS